MNRPFPSTGAGWILALLALLLSIAALTGIVPVGGNAVWWAALFLSLALLI